MPGFELQPILLDQFGPEWLLACLFVAVLRLGSRVLSLKFHTLAALPLGRVALVVLSGRTIVRARNQVYTGVHLLDRCNCSVSGLLDDLLLVLVIAAESLVFSKTWLHHRGPVLFRLIRDGDPQVTSSGLSFEIHELTLVQPRDGLLFVLYLLVEWISPELLPSDRMVDLLPPKPIRNDSLELLSLFMMLVVVDFLDRRLGVVYSLQHQ